MIFYIYKDIEEIIDELIIIMHKQNNVVLINLNYKNNFFFHFQINIYLTIQIKLEKNLIY